MALTVRELIERTREKYRLRLLAGKGDLDFVVTWVHMTEDTNVAEFFWGNELVVTSGYAAQNEDRLRRLVDTMVERDSTGIVINVGKYISEVPPAVIAYCESRHLPLLTMPWEMSITEFVRECCSLINKSSRDDDDLANAVIHIIRAPQESGSYQAQLTDYFRESNGFLILTVQAELTEPNRNVLDHRSTLRLHTALRVFSFPYLVFRYHKRFVVLLNQTDRSVAGSAAQRILEMLRESMPHLSFCIGIGEPVSEFSHLSDSYHAAVSAVRRASLQKLEIVNFREMGFYKLLYSIPNDSLLLDYYHEVMNPLLLHDQKHNSCYTETLFRYLLCDGSLQEVAAAMFTHRNTVNYRMGRIRELLGKQLDSQRERLPYLLAYHVGVILNLVSDLESS